jgi:hypothetical protein
MKSWLRALTAFVLGIMFALASVVAIAFYWRWGNHIQSRVTASSIQAVRPGMTLNELYANLGEPIQIRTKSPIEARCFLDYSERGWLNEGYTVTVEATSAEVVSVLVEYSDMAVYRCDRDQCPQFIWRRDLLDALGR